LGDGSEKEVFSNIAGVSLALHEAFPEHFLPYLFNRRFDRFSAICEAFTIPIPKPPGKMHKRERALYYAALNQALQEFRGQHFHTEGNGCVPIRFCATRDCCRAGR
jgi:hypothetical protein